MTGHSFNSRHAVFCVAPTAFPQVLDLYQKRSGGVHFVEVDNAAAPECF
jgi:hypothetical protein